jgi:hypothetical protein
MDHLSRSSLLSKLHGLGSLLRRRRAVAGSLLALAAVWGVYLVAPGRSPQSGGPESSAEQRRDARGPQAAQPPLSERVPPQPSAAAPVALQPSAAEALGPEQLARALAADNAGDRIQALRAVRAAGSPAALPQLLALEPAADPELAPTLIVTAAELAQKADREQRTAAGRRLQQWLRGELTRAGQPAREEPPAADQALPEDSPVRANNAARGNVAVLVEALGSLHSPEASAALIEALDSGQLPVHVATVAVQGLAQPGDSTARDAVQRFRDRLDQLPAAAGFERELRAEATQAADRTLALLQR